MNDTPQNIAPSLNPALDRAGIAERFARFGRVHIPSFLTEASAARVQRCLEQDTPYLFAVNSGDGEKDVWYGDPAELKEEGRRRLTVAAYQAAQGGAFQFLHETHHLSGDGEPYADPAHCHAGIVAFLNSTEFLDFARAVTGMAEIAFADAQATRYAPGHFLTTHDDTFPERKRLAAYVLNMTPRWRTDWGGILMFPDGNTVEGYAPAFNALNLFKVPQPHLVSQVTPLAVASRYSITGWLRAR